MSDTPRTDSRLTAILDADGFVDQSNCPQRWVNHGRELERELNAANERNEHLRDKIDGLYDLSDSIGECLQKFGKQLRRNP